MAVTKKYIDKKFVRQEIDFDKKFAKHRKLTQQDMDAKLTIQRDQIREDTEELMKKYTSELLTAIDPILKEVSASREERTVAAHQTLRNTKRIEKLESAVFKN